jgi:hypothetical protein
LTFTTNSLGWSNRCLKPKRITQLFWRADPWSRGVCRVGFQTLYSWQRWCNWAWTPTTSRKAVWTNTIGSTGTTVPRVTGICLDCFFVAQQHQRSRVQRTFTDLLPRDWCLATNDTEYTTALGNSGSQTTRRSLLEGCE